ncbi:MAG: alpha/beta hydrolase [Bacteroidales bacterium]
MKHLWINASDGFKIAAAVFEHENPKALVQIIHGSVEHKERYYDFAEFLNAHDYAVILSDNRGHGESVDSVYTLGYMDSYEQIIDDNFRVSNHICAMYPDKKLFLFGHSLGSVFARCYLEKHDDRIAKLAISGTVEYNILTPLGIFLTKMAIAISGKRAYNSFLRYFIMNGKDVSWISYNKKNIRQYKADPLCGFAYPNESVLTVMEAVRELKESKHYQCKNPDLPILSITGAEDPVTGGEAGLERSFRMLEKCGYKNLEKIVFPHMKHEVLNETNHTIVYQAILDFWDENSHNRDH